MIITYKNSKIERICNDATMAIKQLGQQQAVKLHQRIDVLSAAESIDELLRFRLGRCHALDGKRKGQYAMDLIQPYRLVFKQGDDESAVHIIEIIDYH